MRRKIIKQGNNTLTVTLPSKWVKKFDIKPSDEIEISERGKEIVLSPSLESPTRSVSIDISNLSTTAIWRYISSAYRAGYDEIKVTFDSKGHKKLYTAFTYNTLPTTEKEGKLSPIEAIQALVNRFVGVEIIDHGHNQCVIRELGGISPSELDNAVRRIFHLLQLMSEKLFGALEGNKDELKEILIIDTNLDRFEDFCLRILNKYGCGEYRKTQAMYTLIFLLELLGDEYKKLSLHFLNIKGNVNKNVKTFLEHVNDMCELFYEMYYKFSRDSVERIFEMNSEIPGLFDRLARRMSKEEIELLNHLKRMGKFVYSLTELRIDLEHINL